MSERGRTHSSPIQTRRTMVRSIKEIAEKIQNSGGSQVKIIGECDNIKIVSWLLEQHRKYFTSPRNLVQQKIEDYLRGQNISFVFRNPVWFDRPRKSFFVDYYIPGYRVLVDIRPTLSSPYFNAETEKTRRRYLQHLSGYIYLPVDFSDLKDDRYVRKIKRAFEKSLNKIYKI